MDSGWFGVYSLYQIPLVLQIDLNSGSRVFIQGKCRFLTLRSEGDGGSYFLFHQRDSEGGEHSGPGCFVQKNQTAGGLCDVFPVTQSYY